MSSFDEFASQLFEEAKRFLEKAAESTDVASETAHLHAALLIGFCALEAHVSAVADDFLDTSNLELLERSLLAEKDVELVNGQFRLARKLKMTHLEDRIAFLVRKYSGKPLDTQAPWWSDLQGGLKLRNSLTHAKDSHHLAYDDVSRSLAAIVEALSVLYAAVYKRKYPASGRRLSSSLSF